MHTVSRVNMVPLLIKGLSSALNVFLVDTDQTMMNLAPLVKPVVIPLLVVHRIALFVVLVHRRQRKVLRIVQCATKVLWLLLKGR